MNILFWNYDRRARRNSKSANGRRFGVSRALIYPPDRRLYRLSPDGEKYHCNGQFYNRAFCRI
ncbi:hypothetical protein, partial [Alicyclobacillus acidoterrestris]|uniref:hypothetical protein n=1 Tax=Alicyclobacillus acidoterrestris TaxID=1450 RepID=UPI001F37584F